MNNKIFLFLSFLLLFITTFYTYYFVIIVALILLVNYNKPLEYLYILTLAFMLGLIAYSKDYRLSTDLVTYFNEFDMIKNHDLLNIFREFKSDYLYYIFMKLFSTIGLTFSEFLFFVNFIFYINLLLALKLFSKKILLTFPSFIIISVIIYSSYTLMNLSTHLVRQMLASSFLLISIALYINNSKKYIITLFIMLFIHSSSLIFIPLFFYGIIKKQFSFVVIVILFIVSIILSQSSFIINTANSLHINIFFINKLQGEIALMKDEGGVSPYMMLLSGIFLTVLAYLIYKKNQKQFTVIFNPFYYNFIIFFSLMQIPLLHSRFAFYQDIFYLVSIPIIISYINHKFIYYLSIFVLIISILSYNNFYGNTLWQSTSNKNNLLNESIFEIF